MLHIARGVTPVHSRVLHWLEALLFRACLFFCYHRRYESRKTVFEDHLNEAWQVDNVADSTNEAPVHNIREEVYNNEKTLRGH